MMEILYKCKCMPAEVPVAVPEREKGQDLGPWMNKVGVAILADHQLRSPMCGEDKMEYAKIPMPENAPFLGAKPKLDS